MMSMMGEIGERMGFLTTSDRQSDTKTYLLNEIGYLAKMKTLLFGRQILTLHWRFQQFPKSRTLRKRLPPSSMNQLLCRIASEPIQVLVEIELARTYASGRSRICLLQEWTTSLCEARIRH